MNTLDLPGSNSHINHTHRHVGFVCDLCEAITETTGKEDEVFWLSYDFAICPMCVNDLADLL